MRNDDLVSLVSGQSAPFACPRYCEIAGSCTKSATVQVDGVLFKTYYSECLLRTDRAPARIEKNKCTWENRTDLYW